MASQNSKRKPKIPTYYKKSECSRKYNNLNHGTHFYVIEIICLCNATALFLCIQAIKQCVISKPSGNCIWQKWEPPVNVNAGCFKEGYTGWSLVARNHTSDVVFSAWKKKKENIPVDPVLTEALWVRWSLEVAKEQQIELDTSVVVYLYLSENVYGCYWTYHQRLQGNYVLFWGVFCVTY